MSSIAKYTSYFRWLHIFVLTALQSLYLTVKSIPDSFLHCTVELWGPKRYISSEDYVDSTEDFHMDRYYHKILKSMNAFKTAEQIPQHSVAENTDRDEDCGAKPESLEYFWPFDKPVSLNFKNEWIQVVRTKLPEVICKKIHCEKITFTSYRRNRSLIYDFIKSNIRDDISDDDGKSTIRIYKRVESPCSCCSEPWELLGKPKPIRPLDSVVLAEGVMDKVLTDLQSFLKSEEWYKQREIPYRRGYLLYGPPGCGKSSLVRALASEISHGICVLSLTGKMSDFELGNYINQTPSKTIILLEDIGAVFSSREEEYASSADKNLAFGGGTCCSVTFSGLLNALDGVIASEGRIIFMTTNHLERIDPALLRPGRVDRKINIDYPTDSQLSRVFNRFYSSGSQIESDLQGDDDLALLFVQRVRAVDNVKVTMAMVQGLFCMFKKEQDRLAVVDQVDEYFRDQHMTSYLTKHAQNLDFYC